MEIAGPLVPARFVRRENRFRALVEVAGRLQAAHVPNSGRLHELFVPGRPVMVRPVQNLQRKTAYDLVLVQVDGRWVSLDARLPAPIFLEAWRARRLAEFADYTRARREVPLGNSRLDLLLEGTVGRCWVETKSVTLVCDGTGLFPDAVTARGRRHVESLVQAVQQGDRAAVVFIVQRSDAVRFRPHDASDPAFGRALRAAVAAGVEVYAYTCYVTEQSITLASRIPVQLAEPV